MKEALPKSGCDPSTFGNRAENGELLSLDKILRGCAFINGTTFPVYMDISPPSQAPSTQETDRGAVLYIIVVLVFYSAGIVVMIIKYLRREKRELEDERILEDFFRSMPACKKEREQNKVNKVAIHAFHALTSFSYDDGDDIVYTTDDEDVKDIPHTIHEHEFEDSLDILQIGVTNKSQDTRTDTAIPSDVQVKTLSMTEDVSVGVYENQSKETHL